MRCATVGEGSRSAGCPGAGDALGWLGDTIRRRRRDDPARALAARSGLQPALGADGPGSLSRLSRLCGPARQGSGAPQPVAQVLGVHAPRRCGRHPARPSALRQRPAHGHAIVSTARHAAPAARVHAAVSGSSGPHAAAGARQQRLHPESRQCARVPRPQHIGGPAGRHRRPLRVRSHGGGGPAPACDRHGRDAGRSGRRQGPIRRVGGPARPSAGTDDQPARTQGWRSGLPSFRRLFSTDHRGAADRAGGGHRQRPGARAGRR